MVSAKQPQVLANLSLIIISNGSELNEICEANSGERVHGCYIDYMGDPAKIYIIAKSTYSLACAEYEFVLNHEIGHDVGYRQGNRTEEFASEYADYMTRDSICSPER